jgi:hypothetical protein
LYINSSLSINASKRKAFAFSRKKFLTQTDYLIR